jgi:hypothetical protein
MVYDLHREESAVQNMLVVRKVVEEELQNLSWSRDQGVATARRA